MRYPSAYKRCKMVDVMQLVRPEIRALQPYSSARDEFAGAEGVFLDANENPFGELNRYPDPFQRALKARISVLKQVPEDSIFLGNGSDEVLDLLFRVFAVPGEDSAVIFEPTYGMYRVLAAVNAVQLINFPLDADFQPSLEGIRQLKTQRAKLLFLCSPNNPTGNCIDQDRVEQVLRDFPGMVVIDEAYQDFATGPSWTTRLEEFPNLIVLQTFSKAWGLAGARVGMGFASPEVVQLFNKVKPPYNISSLSQQAVLNALADPALFRKNVEVLLAERDRLTGALAQLPIVKHIYPSETNFLLVRIQNARKVYKSLVGQRIILRNRSKLVKDCLRITVGAPEENDQLINALANE